MFAVTCFLDEFARRIRLLDQAPSRVADVADRAAAMLFSDSVQSFLRQRDPVTGAAWVPSRRAIQQHGQTLLDTRRLSRSVSTSVTESTGRFVVNGYVGVVYGKIHQFGSLRRHVPQRRFLGYTRESIAQIAQMLARAVRAGNA